MSSATVSEMLKQHELNNGNVDSKESNNDNDIEKYSVRPGKSRAEVDALADKLVEVFANPDSRRFYCKAAMRMSEGAIWNNVEIALKSDRSPARYFTWLCKQVMG